MRLISTLFTLLALPLALPAIASPVSLIPIEKYQGDILQGSYIVTLRNDGVAPNTFLQTTNLTATHQWTIINGFAGKFSNDQVEAFRAQPDVASIAEDGIMYASALTTQTNATLGLARLSSPDSLSGNNPRYMLMLHLTQSFGCSFNLLLDPARLTTYTYEYDDSAGSGVDIYIVDTGVYIQHTQFGGRASWGGNFVPNTPDEDDNGHGTHCAGTAAGIDYGVAKKANIIAVKVLSGPVSGLDYVSQAAGASGRPSVTSMSFGGGVSAAIDAAVTTAAAGNEDEDASFVSPADVPTDQ
ncbi:hypothetical protein H0H92_008577 [Tricholoma furcatifolium]|nr:hypothetical protein H0H92_008577 [Tricholoma furcatifolium]